MALTKQVEIDVVAINYDEFGRIEITEHTAVQEDGEHLISKRTKRYLYPGYAGNSNVYNHTNVSGEDSSVQKVAELWNNSIHGAYAAHIGAEII